MLVLSRKSGERIQIGEDITVEIRRVAGNRVTVAIAAPRSIRILRGELERAAKEFSGTPPVPAELTPRPDSSLPSKIEESSQQYVIAEASLAEVSQLQNI